MSSSKTFPSTEKARSPVATTIPRRAPCPYHPIERKPLGSRATESAAATSPARCPARRCPAGHRRPPRSCSTAPRPDRSRSRRATSTPRSWKLTASGPPRLITPAKSLPASSIKALARSVTAIGQRTSSVNSTPEARPAHRSIMNRSRSVSSPPVATSELISETRAMHGGRHQRRNRQFGGGFRGTVRVDGARRVRFGERLLPPPMHGVGRHVHEPRRRPRPRLERR